jgi:hypothetical protein
MSEIRDQAALDRVLKRYGHVNRYDFDESRAQDRASLQGLASKLSRSPADLAESREAYALLVRIAPKYNVPLLTKRLCEQRLRVCERQLDGVATPGDVHVLTKEEALAQAGEIEHTEQHE